MTEIRKALESLGPELSSQIKKFLEWNKDGATENETLRLLDEPDSVRNLEQLFCKRLEFGTSGLRARMGTGFAQMNPLTIIQTTQGLCEYLQKTVNLKQDGVVIGRDHRHNSEQFARLTAAVFLSQNIKVHYFPGLVHTPMVPFAVKHLGAACGIMITASHNPKDDNGYKVYWGNGCQIIPPHDKHIAELITKNLTPTTWDADLVLNSQNVTDPTYLVQEYFGQIVKNLRFRPNAVKKQNARFCYTPMHGVGLEFAKAGFKLLGFEPFVEVEKQAQPDPDFPTVIFPNPEEKGALDMAMEVATRENCSIVLSNDPDADRFAVAEYQKPTNDWYVFSGDELGIILASIMIKASNDKKIGVVTTVVSSHMLQAMAEKEGIKYEETLTGFKWLGNKAIDLAKAGYNPVFAYEESIGYMCHDTVFDKDGVSALMYFAEWANDVYGNKLTVKECLNTLYEKYGYWISKNSYLICKDKNLVKSVFDSIRYGVGHEKVLNYPETIAGFKVVYVRDLTIGFDSSTVDHKPTLPVSSSTQMITFKLENNIVITLRTSGTEPKVKYYTEYCSNIGREDGVKFLSGIVNLMLSELLIPLVACHPLDTIKVRLQLRGQKGQNFIRVGASIVQKEGFLALYKGLGAVVTGIVPKQAIRFASFDFYKSKLGTDSGSIFLSGLFAGATESVMVVNPMDVIKIRLQSQRHSMTDPLDVPKYRNAAHCAYVMVQEEGFSSLYKGVSLTIIRQGTNQAANFTVYQYLKQKLSEKQDVEVLPHWQTFFIGIVSGACGPLFNAPVDTIKTRIQRNPSREKGFQRVVSISKGILNNEGFGAFYRGLTPRVLRVAPGQGITFMVYEYVYKALTNLNEKLSVAEVKEVTDQE